MSRSASRKTEANRAAIYARVSDKSQDGEDKTSISEQIGEMEAHCESGGLTIVARYQEVGRGWSKKRPEFQRMLVRRERGTLRRHRVLEVRSAQQGHVPCGGSHGGGRGAPDTARSRHGRHRHEDLRADGGHRQDRAGQLSGAVGNGQAWDGQAGPCTHGRPALRIPDW